METQQQQQQTVTKRHNYKPDPDMSLTHQAEIYYGANYIGINKKLSIYQTVTNLGWPIKGVGKKNEY